MIAEGVSVLRALVNAYRRRSRPTVGRGEPQDASRSEPVAISRAAQPPPGESSRARDQGGASEPAPARQASQDPGSPPHPPLVSTPTAPNAAPTTRAARGWAYEVAPTFQDAASVPPRGIVGAWKIDDTGSPTGDFVRNPSFRARRMTPRSAVILVIINVVIACAVAAFLLTRYSSHAPASARHEHRTARSSARLERPPARTPRHATKARVVPPVRSTRRRPSAAVAQPA